MRVSRVLWVCLVSRLHAFLRLLHIQELRVLRREIFLDVLPPLYLETGLLPASAAADNPQLSVLLFNSVQLLVSVQRLHGSDLVSDWAEHILVG